jgi:hypothetical protein
MVLNVGARVSQEVDEGSLLDEVVLGVDADVLNLLLGGHEPLHLGFLGVVSPLGNHLLGLVARVHVVEVGEFGSNQESEMAHLGYTKVEGKDVLVMEDHTSEPFVMGPAAHAGEGGDGTNVEEKEDQTASGAGEGLVMRGDLLGANSFEQGLHVVEVVEGDRVGFGVVRVLVTLLHSAELVSVVSLAVLGLVNGVSPNNTTKVIN